MKRYFFAAATPYLIAAIFALLLIVSSASATNSVGYIYSEAGNDKFWGGTVDYEKKFNSIFKVGAEGQLQSGTTYLGDLDIALTFDLPVNVRLEWHSDLKGYVIKELGFRNDVTASLVFPYKDTEWSFGFFGAKSNPFAPAYRLANPHDPTSAELIDSGLRMPDGSSLGMAVKGELDVAMLEVGTRGLFQLFGKGDKTHQLELDVETGGDLIGGFDWNVQAKITAQVYQETDAEELVTEIERAIIIGVKYPF